MVDTTGIRIPLPEGDAIPSVVAAAYRPALASVAGELHAAAIVRGELDSQTRELVRLRCATWHNCRACKSVREVVGGERMVDESMAAQVADYENSDLSDRHKVALRIADAFMTKPGRIDDQQRVQIRRHFSDGEVTEILFNVIAWTSQKPLVALGLDLPIDATALSDIAFDETGNVAFVGPPRQSVTSVNQS